MEVKKMRNQKGKINLSSILIFLLLFYGAFVAFRLISSRITKSQIKNEIIDRFGYIRGTEFTPQKGENVILDILEEHGLYSDEFQETEDENASNAEGEVNKDTFTPKIFVEIHGSKIRFVLEYSESINLLLFKMTPKYIIEDEMLNYN
jgi:hypothetical protein